MQVFYKNKTFGWQDLFELGNGSLTKKTQHLQIQHIMVQNHDSIWILINYIDHILKVIDPLLLTFDPIISEYLINKTPLISMSSFLVRVLNLLEVFYPEILQVSLLEKLHHLHQQFNLLQLLQRGLDLVEVLEVLLPDFGKSKLLLHFFGLASEACKERVLDET